MIISILNNITIAISIALVIIKLIAGLNVIIVVVIINDYRYLNTTHKFNSNKRKKTNN